MVAVLSRFKNFKMKKKAQLKGKYIYTYNRTRGVLKQTKYQSQGYKSPFISSGFLGSDPARGSDQIKTQKTANFHQKLLALTWLRSLYSHEEKNPH